MLSDSSKPTAQAPRRLPSVSSNAYLHSIETKSETRNAAPHDHLLLHSQHREPKRYSTNKALHFDFQATTYSPPPRILFTTLCTTTPLLSSPFPTSSPSHSTPYYSIAQLNSRRHTNPPNPSLVNTMLSNQRRINTKKSGRKQDSGTQNSHARMKLRLDPD